MYQILEGTMKASGLNVTEEEFAQWHGTNKRDVIAHFVNSQRSDVDVAAREAEIQRIFDEFMAGIEKAYFSEEQKANIRVFPGTIDVLRKLRAAGIKVALNTGTPSILLQTCKRKIS